MSKAYVIGSLSQAARIKECADTLNDRYDEVSYVKVQDNKSFEEIVSECFDEIEKADVIYAFAKRFDNDRSNRFGKGVTYELEYAKRLGKEVFIIYDLELEFQAINFSNPTIDKMAKELLDAWKASTDMSNKDHHKN